MSLKAKIDGLIEDHLFYLLHQYLKHEQSKYD